MTELSAQAKFVIVVAFCVLLVFMFIYLLSGKKVENLGPVRLMPPKKWKCYKGFNVPLRKIGKDVQCLSTDGTNCMWQNSAEGCANLLDSNGLPIIPRGKRLNPLNCGADHYKIYHNIGYDQPGHWCRNGIPKDILNYTG